MGKKLKMFFSVPIVMGIAFSLAIVMSESWAFPADVVVVANKDIDQSSLSSDKIKAIFLGQITVWEDGTKVHFIVMQDNSGIHEAFLREYLGKTSAQFSSYWKQQVFTGKGRLPKKYESESKIIEYISSTKGAIGYVSAAAARRSAKVITIY